MWDRRPGVRSKGHSKSCWAMDVMSAAAAVPMAPCPLCHAPPPEGFGPTRNGHWVMQEGDQLRMHTHSEARGFDVWTCSNTLATEPLRWLMCKAFKHLNVPDSAQGWRISTSC